MIRVKELERLADVISLYRDHGMDAAKAERQYFADLPSFVEAVRIAGGGNIREGERHDHLENIDDQALEIFRDELLRSLPELEGCVHFDELYRALWSKRIKGKIGPVTVYDTAISIGSQWDEWLEPDVVYLHAGTAKGAYKLGVTPDTKRIHVTDLPESLHEFTPAQVEDILCEYFKKRTQDRAEIKERRRNR